MEDTKKFSSVLCKRTLVRLSSLTDNEEKKMHFPESGTMKIHLYFYTMYYFQS